MSNETRMSTENLVLQPLQSEIHYQGGYAENPFALLAAPAPLYQSLLKHLGVLGATLRNLKIETPNFADSHISCTLADLHTEIRVRLDRFDVDCWKTHEIGAETAERIVLATWTAIHEADDSIKLVSHKVDLNILAEIQGGTCWDLLAQYVRTPQPLGIMDLGVAFYTRPIQNNQEPWINIVPDRVFRQDNRILIKLTVGYDAGAVPIEKLAVAMDGQTNHILDGLGVHFRKRVECCRTK